MKWIPKTQWWLRFNRFTSPWKNPWIYLPVGLVLAFFLLFGLLPNADRGFISPPPQNNPMALNSGSADEHPQFSYNGRYLIFASDRQTTRNLFLYDWQQRRFLNLPGVNSPNSRQDEPDISGDGRYLVYISEENGKVDVYLYDRQTNRKENLTKNLLGAMRHPTISGNGRLVAFENNRRGQWHLEIYDRGGNTPLSLPDDNGARLPLTVSPLS